MAESRGARVAEKIRRFQESVAGPVLLEIAENLVRRGSLGEPCLARISAGERGFTGCERPREYEGFSGLAETLGTARTWGSAADAVFQEMLAAAMPGLRSVDVLLREPETLEGGEHLFIGPSLAVQVGRPDRRNPHRNKFLLSIQLAISPRGAVLASPVACYYMATDHRLHRFPQRFDPRISLHRAERVRKEHIHDHFVSAFDQFRLCGQLVEAPW